MLGDLLKVILNLLYRFGIELEQVFAPLANAVNNSRPLQHAKMFGDGLASQSGAFCQLRNGTRLTDAEFCD